MTRSEITTTKLSLAGFIVILLVAWLCYQPALTGDFQLDDRGNLSGLAAVDDRDSAIGFIMSGVAGPTGRPLALLSFALQADAWDDNPRAFIAANIAIHLMNAAILAACLFQLSLLMGTRRDRAALIGVLAAGVWVLMPLAASATLLIVQRMTMLSATFTFLGLLGYLLARGRVETAPRSALVWMGASLALGTSLGTLSKETGILLPFYVLAIEATLLSTPASVPRRYWRLLQVLFLGIPVALIVGYLVLNASYTESAIARRGFDGWERLLTQSELLWVYLKKALVGTPSTLGVFQESPDLNRGLFEPATLLSVAMWIAVAVAGFVYRRRWPLLAFAIAWYLSGHILESTVLQLELYFEHRNYVPIVGPVFAVVASLLLVERWPAWTAITLVSCYLAISALMLVQIAAMSGESSTSSRYWAHKYPGSVRAVMTMATYQLAEEGALRTLTTLDEFVLRNPQHSYLRIQELNLRCLAMPAADHGVVIEQLHRQLPSAEFTLTTGTMLSQLFDTISSRQCNGVDTQTLLAIAASVLENQRYATFRSYRQFHYRLNAAVARKEGRIEEAINFVEQAIAAQPSSELNMMMVTALGSIGDYDAARDFIDAALLHAPTNPVRSFQWRRDLHILRDYIDELERYSLQQE